MTINERIRRLRKDYLEMNQTEFAQLIGMKQTGVSSFEKIGATVTDQTIKSICFAVDGLNEEWLRTGNGEMIIKSDNFSLDKFAKDHGATELELQIIKTYFELDPDTRKMLVELFKKGLSSSASTEKLEEEYKKSRSESVRKTEPSASSTTSGTQSDEDEASGQ